LSGGRRAAGARSGHPVLVTDFPPRGGKGHLGCTPGDGAAGGARTKVERATCGVEIRLVGGRRRRSQDEACRAKKRARVALAIQDAGEKARALREGGENVRDANPGAKVDKVDVSDTTIRSGAGGGALGWEVPDGGRGGERGGRRSHNRPASGGGAASAIRTAAAAEARPRYRARVSVGSPRGRRVQIRAAGNRGGRAKAAARRRRRDRYAVLGRFAVTVEAGAAGRSGASRCALKGTSTASHARSSAAFPSASVLRVDGGAVGAQNLVSTP